MKAYNDSVAKEADLKTAKDNADKALKDAKAAFEQMKKDAAAAKKEIEAAGKELVDKVKAVIASSSSADVQKGVDEIKKAAQDKIDQVKQAMDKNKPDKETKIDDKNKPAKLLMEWPEVLSNMADNKDAE